jgi:hypothetical protein
MIVNLPQYKSGTGITIDSNNTIGVTDPVIQNTAQHPNSVTVKGVAAEFDYSINIGTNSETQDAYGSAIGALSKVIGSNGTAIGYNSKAEANSTAIGAGAKASGVGSIQLGAGDNQGNNTMKVCLGSTNYALLDSNGRIPTDRLSLLFDALYPVGAVYLGTQSTCPLATLMPNATWQLVSSDKALWTGDGTNGGTTIAAALPNIKGFLTVQDGAGASKKWAPGCTVSGAITKENLARDAVITGSAVNFDDSFDLGINAHEYNSIYDDNATTVQPPAYVVNVWVRTA